MFEITLDKEIEKSELNSVILNIEPLAKICNDVLNCDAESNVLAETSSTNDSKWSCRVTITSKFNSLCSETAPIDFVQTVHRILGLNCIMYNCEFVSGLDPQDPYWCFAYIDGVWYFASTAGMPLMGSYFGAYSSFAGSSDIKLLKSVDLRNPSPDMFSAVELGVNKIE